MLGKGLGESIVIGLGKDEWVIVDSFFADTNDGRSEPAPLTYLRERGTTPEQVSAVVLTHLHDDHYRGIDEVVRQSRNATFYLPDAIPDRDWQAFLSRASRSGRRARLDDVVGAFRIALDQRRFQAVGATALLDTRGCELFVIGPSVRAQASSREVYETGDADAEKALRLQNCTSIVLWLRAGNAVALLGGDMENHGVIGWEALLEEHQRKEWLRGAGLVKIPHHGSEGAHNPDVYARWTAEPAGVVTPNTRGANGLPRAETLGELTRVTSSLWLAGPLDGADLGPEDIEATSSISRVVSRCDRDGTGDNAGVWDMSLTAPTQRIG